MENNTENTFEIRNCPFCGGEAILHANWSYRYKKYYVNCKCTICGSSGKGFPTADDPDETDWKDISCSRAVKLWNSRVQ